MEFSSIVVTTLLALFGGALVVAAFKVQRVIAWENRKMLALAEMVREYRENLEEEQRLLASEPPRLRLLPARSAERGRRHDRAA
ncbi:MAG: hypothetical protein LBG83_05225 [Oscillospiraceae bacterium]|jgi:hypothetical protein|nr:hypothetical protein [Oscillospiraceae bacterium]